MRFEATNLGEKPTSLAPTISVTALTPKTEKRRFDLNIQEPDRQLLSHAPKVFTAMALLDVEYPFWWYKKYCFLVTKGAGSIVRYRNAMNEDMGFAKYWFDYVLFRYLKVVKTT